MRILMLGWEFPPFIAGGLGTACYGLTRALDALGHEIIFVLPKHVDRSKASHVRLVSPDAAPLPPQEVERAARVVQRVEREEPITPDDLGESGLDKGAISEFQLQEFEHTTFRAIPSGITSPYGPGAGLSEEQVRRLVARQAAIERGETPPDPGAWASSPHTQRRAGSPPSALHGEVPAADRPTPGFGLAPTVGSDYGGDLMGDVRRYAEMCVALCRHEHFDLIHAHDWLTFPGGMAIARLTGKPLIAHVHSTEYDRSGEWINRPVHEIERRGMHSALRVITVSFWTQNIVRHRYGVSPEKIRVVWNGVELSEHAAAAFRDIKATDKIVLFLGRITMQKGPEYFIAAAKRVLEKMNNVKFIVAGSGDMATRMIELAAQMGIGHKVLFTGFLRGDDVARIYKMADCYVMPSVSEPFGIAPLEAMSHDVPVIISKQSGVSEVLSHALKVDFWDVDEMANKIVAVLKYPPLGQTLRRHGSMEVRNLTWDGAARKCTEVYEEALTAMGRVGG